MLQTANKPRIIFVAAAFYLAMLACFDFDWYNSNSYNPSLYQAKFMPVMTVPLLKTDQCSVSSITGMRYQARNCEQGVAIISQFNSLMLSFVFVVLVAAGASYVYGKKDALLKRYYDATS